MFFFGAPHSQHFALLLLLLLNACIHFMYHVKWFRIARYFPLTDECERKKKNFDLEHNDQRCTGNTYEWKGFIQNNCHN